MHRPPLSERLRPENFDEVFGQDHLLGEEGFLRKILQGNKPFSLLFFGPPGCGKTTLAKLYGKAFCSSFVPLSAVSTSISEIKKILLEEKEKPLFGNPPILFIDEIHRYNKAQQDFFLPYLEEGSLILVGATTENPSFVLNGALLSRLRVLPLYPLIPSALEEILKRYEKKISPLPLSEESKKYLLTLSQGDGRHLLHLIENLEHIQERPISRELLEKISQKRAPLYDKDGEMHYNLISAFHKALRGSDPDASLYWLLRMLEGGEDPLFIARRMIRMASEDIGLADPQALQIALSAHSSYAMLGSPEGELALAEAAIFLALAPKSNALYIAFEEAQELAKKTTHLLPPPSILNAPTPLMKELGYSKGYLYDHDTKEGFSGQNYFPQGMERPSFYLPKERGWEREMKKRLLYFQSLRNAKKS